jgi:hypothetical protein
MNTPLSNLVRVVRPDLWLGRRLAAVPVRAPRIDWDAIADGCPWLGYERLGWQIRGEYPLGPADPFARFGSFVEEPEIAHQRAVDVRDVFGISASKSHIVRLDRLSRTGSVPDILATHSVDELIKQVLHGLSDCVAREGESVSIVEQAWDGRLYVLNDGGSHRFAAIWRWHRENGRRLPMECSITTARISAETTRAVRQHRYWLVSAPWGANLLDLLNAAGDRSLFPRDHPKPGGIALRPISPWHGAGEDGWATWCVAFPREHRMAAVVDRWLEGGPAVDLSAMVMGLADAQAARTEAADPPPDEAPEARQAGR